jgi:AcrR family transcriptional regulator
MPSGRRTSLSTRDARTSPTKGSARAARATGARTGTANSSARAARAKGSARARIKGSARSDAASRDQRAAGTEDPAQIGPPRIGPPRIAPPRIAPPRIAPLYKRLPHGPHRLARNEVILNQRARIHGALVEAVARNGYEETSVKQVIGLAGVSRRSFYEQFANKQACFLVTFDLIARRELQQIRRAYLASDGTLEQRTLASFQRFAHTVAEDRNSAVLAVLEAQTAGVPGVLRLRKAIGACEHMLVQSFTPSFDATPLPIPVVRGIAGGLHGIASSFLRQQQQARRAPARGRARAAQQHAHAARDRAPATQQHAPATHQHAPAAQQHAPAAQRHACAGSDLAREMLTWTLLFQTPAAESMSEQMAARLTTRIREISSAYGHGLGGAEATSRDERTRLLQSILRLATREDYRVLSAPQIADEANVPIDAFCQLFADKDECYLDALDMIGDELLAIAADPDLVSGRWPHAVRRVLSELLRYLAEHPLQTRTLAQEAFFAGPQALERVLDLSHSIATLLTEGAPAPASGALTVDAIAGALWHTIRCQVAAGRIPLLAALCEHLTFIVLAPYIGADAAASFLSEEPAALAAVSS